MARLAAVMCVCVAVHRQRWPCLLVLSFHQNTGPDCVSRISHFLTPFFGNLTSETRFRQIRHLRCLITYQMSQMSNLAKSNVWEGEAPRRKLRKNFEKRPEDVPNASGWYGRLLVQKLTVLLFLGGFAIRQRVGRSMLRIHRCTPCWAHRASSQAIRLFLTR